MNWIDVSLIIVVFFGVLSGWKKGFILGILDLVSLIGSIIAGLYFYQYLGTFFQKNIPSLGVWTLPVAFLIIIVVARIIFSLITRAFLSTTSNQVYKNGANRFFGIIPGTVNGIINASILAALLLAIPISDELSDTARESKIAGKLATQMEGLEAMLSPIFDEAIRRSMNNLTVDPASEKSVDLHYSVTNPRVRPNLEMEMLDMVNEERLKMGLKVLKADPEMAQVARTHSADMFARGYFSHVSPEGKTLADRIRSAGVSFVTAGENLALGPTLTICHDGLMKSPGHRKNILHPSFGRLGIGILDGGRHGLMITQNFRN